MQKIEIKGIQIRKEEVKLFSDDTITDVENPKDSTKIIVRINKFNKVADKTSTFKHNLYCTFFLLIFAKFQA